MTSPNRLNQPKWERVEAGYYRRPISLSEMLEVVRMDHTPADWMFHDKWVVRLSKRTKHQLHGKVTNELGRFATKAEATTYADQWRTER